ncbi:MAG: recombinase family protein [Hyphomicrobium sp.]
MTRIACAIYTRKSSDEGLEKEFNSLDAQREASEAYVLSQKHAGWVALRDLYDDGGLSGGTMERPALQRLLADIKGGKVQIVVVYKVDRLTRSLADFAKIVDVFDAHGASFVSVTQQFNTTTSMGRLTLNMLLSFAQFEREIAGERIRDKIAASKAKGMWMGGSIPLGYDLKDRKLIINETEAATVRLIFERYAALESVTLLRTELNSRGVTTKIRVPTNGHGTGGKTFQRGALYQMLQNRLYRGEVAHRGHVYAGQHQGIIDDALWQTVQTRLANNRHERRVGAHSENPSLLAGLIFDRTGRPLTPTHANKIGKRYRYYVSSALLKGDEIDGGSSFRLPAGEVETLVLDRLRSFFKSRAELLAALETHAFSARDLDAAFKRSADRASQWSSISPRDKAELVRAIVLRITIEASQISLSICPIRLVETLGLPASNASSPDPIVLNIAAELKRCGKGKRIVIHNGVRDEINPVLIKILNDAFAARQMLLADNDESLNAIEARLHTSKGRMTSLMRLSYLSPEIIRDTFAGRQPLSLGAKRLIGLSKDLPYDWLAQRAYLGFDRG